MKENWGGKVSRVTCFKGDKGYGVGACSADWLDPSLTIALAQGFNCVWFPGGGERRGRGMDGSRSCEQGQGEMQGGGAWNECDGKQHAG